MLTNTRRQLLRFALDAEGLKALSHHAPDFLAELLQDYDTEKRAMVPTPESLAFKSAMDYWYNHAAPMPQAAFERLGLEVETRTAVIATVALTLDLPLVLHDLPSLLADLKSHWAVVQYGRSTFLHCPRDYEDPAAHIEALTRDLTKVRDRLCLDGRKSVFSISESANEHLQEMRSKRDNPALAKGIPTGFPTLDEKCGGLYPGEITVVAGRAKTGKSMTLLSMARNAWVHGHNVLLINKEMKPDIQLRRLSAIALGHKHMLDGAWDKDLMNQLKLAKMSDEQWEEYVALWKLMENREAKFFQSDPYAVQSLTDVDRIVKQYKEEHGVELVVVDSGQSQAPEGNIDDPHEFQKRAVEALDRIAHLHDVALVVDVQTNRVSGTSKEAGLEAIAHSDVWGRTAYTVLRLWPLGEGTAELQVLAARDGQSGYSIPLHYDIKSGIIIESAESWF